MTVYLGLTGGIATGKSAASNYFINQGVPVVDTDKIAHELMKPGKRNYQGIVEYFGKGILNQDLSINRKVLGQIVFNEAEQLAALNAITHPGIRDETMLQMQRYHEMGYRICVVDVPLLFEAGLEEIVDKTLVIYTTPELELERLMQRDHLNSSAALERIHSQMPLTQKVKKADYAIENTGTIDELERNLGNLLDELRKVEEDGMS
ncbi:dephospho-CoA kinase [Lactobacillus rodentium]|uniref:Dephospho-CoA kinase n=1 Tax=Lactobacillus rodentium TaxID=947835 RepID=A0A2Z6T694_9LACO|nr:dephospho-CoA kinase [Lactobacillus rodentium]MCR1894218.1 dephospho-CoA kinase [Lactobacillus rodentium]GBG04514.1 dephospho-CoA kinase [Lactobacillus rodentium]